MNRLPLTIVAALAASPALAEAPPSDTAVGVAMGQWVILNCPSEDVPPFAYAMVQMILPMIPQVEQDKAFNMVAETMATMPLPEGCDTLISILAQSSAASS